MAIDIITLVIVVIVALILIELVKHVLFKKIYRFFLFSIVIIVILIVLIGYLASRDVISNNNKFVATGAAIMDGVSQNIDKETVNNLTSPIKKIDKEGLRKLYK